MLELFSATWHYASCSVTISHAHIAMSDDENIFIYLVI